MLLLLASLSGCMHETSEFHAVAATRPANVAIADFLFSPATLVVEPGDTVTWTNQDPIAHTVQSGSPESHAAPSTEPSAAFHGELPNQFSTYSHRFVNIGEYPYYCDQHHAMRGLIIVRSSESTSTAPAP